MKLFTAEDFNELFRIAPSRRQEVAAEIANAKIEREGKRVYSMSTDSRYWEDPSDKDLQDAPERCDLSGLIINIEPLEKNQSLEEYIEWVKDYYSKTHTIPIIPKESCEHPKDKVVPYKGQIANYWECECGAKVIPISFEEQK